MTATIRRESPRQTVEEDLGRKLTPVERKLAALELEVGHLRTSIERMAAAVERMATALEAVGGSAEIPVEAQTLVPSIDEQLDARRAERARRNG
jgi:hypothetical protein